MRLLKLAILAIVCLLAVQPPSVASPLYVSNFGTNTILRVEPNGTVTTLATGLNGPDGLALNSQGILFVVNQGAPGTIIKITPDGTKSTFVTGLATTLYDLAVDAGDNVYVSTPNRNTISKITPSGVVSTFANFNGGLRSPVGLVFDAVGNLYAGNGGSNSISKIAPDGTVTQFATGVAGPYGLAFDGDGNLYAASLNNNAILKITSTGSVTTLASGGGLSNPYGLAFADGALYAANFGADLGHTISKIELDGTVSTFATGLLAPTFMINAVPEPTVVGPIVLAVTRLLKRRGRRPKIAGSAA